MMRRFAISDIHGCIRSFQALLERIELDHQDSLFLLGDYIDRGPGSREVIDKIIDLQQQGFRVKCLMGNHESLMLQAGEDRYWLDTWLANGGRATMKSFDAKYPHDIPDEIMDWVKNLAIHMLEDDCVMVHAGLNFGHSDPLEDTDSQLWIRDWYDQIDHKWLKDRIIVHGHTPQTRQVIELMAKKLPSSRVLNIDAGCVFKGHHGYGNLCAVELNSRELFFQPCLD